MPRKHKPRNRRRRRKKESSYRKRIRRALVPFALPKQKTVKLRYVQFIALNPTATTGAGDYGQVQHRFNANSIYQPDVEAAGPNYNQPLYTNTWKALYNKYVVNGSRITVKCSPTSNTNSIPGYLAIHLDDDGTLTETYKGPELVQQLGTKSTIIQSNAGSDTMRSLSNNFSAKKFFNINDMKDNFDRLGAAVTANPSDTAVWFVVAGALNDPTPSDMARIDCMVTIDYVVTFSEPKDIPLSTA